MKLLLALLLFLKIIPLQAQSGDVGVWEQAAPLLEKRTEIAAAALDGKIYAIGGFAQPSLTNALDFAISRTVEVYDTASNRWYVTAPLPEGRHHAGVVALNGLLYVVGGFTKGGLSVWRATTTLYRYDPATQTWCELAPMQAARDHLAVAGANGKIYAIGGRPGLNYRKNMSVVEAFDPLSNQWQPRANLPTPRSGIAAGVIDERIYVVGGESGEGTFNTNEMYLPGEDRWIAMAPMPTARHGLGTAVVDGRLHAMSGGSAPGASFSQTHEIFTPPR